MFFDALGVAFSLILNDPVLFPLVFIPFSISILFLSFRVLYDYVRSFVFVSKDHSTVDSTTEILVDEASLSSQNVSVDQPYISENGACLSSHNYDKTRYQTKLPKYNK